MAPRIGPALGRALGRALAAGLEAGIRSVLRSPDGRRREAPPSRPADRVSGHAADRAADHARAVGRGRPVQPPDRPVGYPGDFTGRATIEYRPDPDGHPDPGEVVWGWVPFEEDHSQGKDRPVLVVGRDGDWLLALMLTSKDHDRDAAQEARFGRVWTDVGTGPWDPRQRPSEVRLDRVLRLDPAGVRREGGTMPRDLFDSVAARLRAVNGW